MTQRNDIHRKGAIIPSHYRHVLSYHSSCVEWEQIAVDCTVRFTPAVDNKWPKRIEDGEHYGDECCLRRLRARGVTFAEHGTTNNCTACGARFNYGDVWVHKTTGEHIHLGHDCADKYGLLTDRSEYEMSVMRMKKDRILAKKRSEAYAQRQAVIKANADWIYGLALCASFNENRFLSSLCAQVCQGRTLTARQKIAGFNAAMKCAVPKKEKKVSTYVGAPKSRIEVKATYVFSTSWNGFYGVSYLHAFEMDSGEKLVWRTGSSIDAQRGSAVSIKGTVKEHSEYKGEKQTVLTRCKIV